MNTDKLKGMAVVSLAEGAKLGQVDAPLFDAATLHLRAFQVTGDGQTFIVPLDQVRTIGTDAVMVESSQATQTAVKGGEFGSLVPFSTLKQLKVVDAAGTFVGTLHDLELEPTTGRALRIVVHKGGLFGLGGETTTIEAAAIRSVGGELITVAEVGATPTD
jgi:sporulation protein YlmC with PRC-barrel domain